MQQVEPQPCGSAVSMQIPAVLRSWRSASAGCPPVSQTLPGSAHLALQRSGNASSAAAAHLAPAARRTHPPQATSGHRVRKRKRQCPTCALTVRCPEQHTWRTYMFSRLCCMQLAGIHGRGREGARDC